MLASPPIKLNIWVSFFVLLIRAVNKPEFNDYGRRCWEFLTGLPEHSAVWKKCRRKQNLTVGDRFSVFPYITGKQHAHRSPWGDPR